MHSFIRSMTAFQHPTTPRSRPYSAINTVSPLAMMDATAWNTSGARRVTDVMMLRS